MSETLNFFHEEREACKHRLSSLPYWTSSKEEVDAAIHTFGDGGAAGTAAGVWLVKLMGHMPEMEKQRAEICLAELHQASERWIEADQANPARTQSSGRLERE